MNIDMLIMKTLGIWIIVVCLKIYKKRNIYGFLFLGISMLVLYFANTEFELMTTILIYLSQLICMTGLLCMGTIEREKCKLLGKTVSKKDIILGRIPSVDRLERETISRIENNIAVIGSSLLVAICLWLYFKCHFSMSELFPIVVLSFAVSIYSLFNM